MNRLIIGVRLALLATCLVVGSAGCIKPDPEPFTVVMSSEGAFLKPVIESAIRSQNFEPKITADGGTIETVEKLRQGPAPDAVSLASPGWMQDTIGGKAVNAPTTVAWSPVVLGIKPRYLTDAHQQTITLADLLKLFNTYPNSVMATRADQSNSSLLFSVGVLSAKRGQGTVTQDDLNRPEADAVFRPLTNSIVKIQGGSGKLVEQAYDNYAGLTGIVGYEALVVQLNTRLQTGGKSPLTVVRVQNGTQTGAITLAYTGSDPAHKKVFDAILSAIKGPEGQRAIQAAGWNTSPSDNTLDAPTNRTLWAAKKRFEQSARYPIRLVAMIYRPKGVASGMETVTTNGILSTLTDNDERKSISAIGPRDEVVIDRTVYRSPDAFIRSAMSSLKKGDWTNRQLVVLEIGAPKDKVEVSMPKTEASPFGVTMVSIDPSKAGNVAESIEAALYRLGG